MRCPACAAPNLPGAARCQKCGAKLPGPAAGSGTPSKPRPAAGPGTPSKPRPAAGPGTPSRARRPEPEAGAIQPERPRRPAAPPSKTSQPEPAEGPRLRRRREPEEPAADEVDVTSTIVPYKNPCALLSYYTGFIALVVGLGAAVGMVYMLNNVSWTPRPQDVESIRRTLFVGFGLGILLGLAGFALGIFGFLFGSAHRASKGKTHALIGTVMGASNVMGQVVALLLLLRLVTTLSGNR
jgi:hypothetical protein